MANPGPTSCPGSQMHRERTADRARAHAAADCGGKRLRVRRREARPVQELVPLLARAQRRPRPDMAPSASCSTTRQDCQRRPPTCALTIRVAHEQRCQDTWRYAAPVKTSGKTMYFARGGQPLTARPHTEPVERERRERRACTCMPGTGRARKMMTPSIFLYDLRGATPHGVCFSRKTRPKATPRLSSIPILL